jgi:hypothetical protein
LNLYAIDGGLTRQITKLPDAMDAENFRILRIWLRWKAISTGRNFRAHAGIECGLSSVPQQAL